MKIKSYSQIAVSTFLGILTVWGGTNLYKYQARRAKMAPLQAMQNTPVEAPEVIDEVALKQAPFVVGKPVIMAAPIGKKGKKIVSPYLDARSIEINLKSVVANAQAGRTFQFPLSNGQLAYVKFNRWTRPTGGATVFEGVISTSEAAKDRRPASLVVAGKYAEGNFSTKSDSYRLLTAEKGATLLLRLNPKMKF